MDTAATADRTPIRKKCNKNFITETFSKYSMISLSILLFRVNTIRIKHQEMSWYNHKPIKHPKEPHLTPHHTSPATDRILKEIKEKVRPAKSPSKKNKS